MDPSEPPPAPASPPGRPEKKPGTFVPLAAGGFFLLFIGAFSYPHWWINLLVFVLFFTALLTARGWGQRVLGVALSGISGAVCLISYLAAV